MEYSAKSLATGAVASAGLVSFGKAALDETVVLITGSSSGFGQRMTLMFACAGYRTVASKLEVSGRNAVKARELRQTALNERLGLSVVELDVTSILQAKHVVDRIISDPWSSRDL